MSCSPFFFPKFRSQEMRSQSPKFDLEEFSLLILTTTTNELRGANKDTKGSERFTVQLGLPPI